MFKIIRHFLSKKPIHQFDADSCPGMDVMPYTGDGRADIRHLPWVLLPYRLRKRKKDGRHFHL